MPKTLRGWLLNADIQDVLDNQAEAWGIKVSNVEIKLVDLDETMIRAIAPQAEAERTRRAKIINAEGRAAGGAEAARSPESWRWGVPFENFRSGSKSENLHASSFRQLRTQSMRNFYDEYDLYYNGDESDSFGFADPGGKSTLRAASKKNPRNLPCPTCNAPNRLTPADRANGYQCESCADADMVKL